MNFPKSNQTSSRVPWWLYGVLFYAGVQAISFGLSALVSAARVAKSKPEQEFKLDEEGSTPPLKPETTETDEIPESSLARSAVIGDFPFYESLIQPRFAPSAPVFPVVWTINNLLTIWGLLHVLRMPKNKPGRREFLAWQGVAWTCYCAFGALFFGMRSTLLAALDTLTMLVATVATMGIALTKLRDTKAVLSQITVLPWLLLAAPTSLCVALWNRDLFFKRGPFLQPSPRLRKSSGAPQEDAPTATD